MAMPWHQHFKLERLRPLVWTLLKLNPWNPHDPLLGLPNAIVTPHLAGFSPTFLEECPIRQAENIIRVLTGKAPWGTR